METKNAIFTAHELPLEKIMDLDRYIIGLEDKEGMLIHILHRAQHLFGYLPVSLQLHIARKVGVPASKVFGVVSFYSYFTQTKRGVHTISVCMGTACFVKGAEEMKKALKSELKVDFGGTTVNGLFTLKEIRCIGACGLAPAMMVDDKVYGHVTPEGIATIIKSYEDEEYKEEEMVEDDAKS